MKKILLLCSTTLLIAALSGCVVSPRTGLVCPPGTHPGPYGHRCFVD